MGKRILLIQGHPDTSAPHLCHALAEAYAGGARQGTHQVRSVTVAQLDFPLLRSQHEWEHGALPPALQQARDDIDWAEHIVLFFPLWLGDMPALVKGFLEQIARPGFAFGDSRSRAPGKRRLCGRSARVVVTMGMPAVVYRWFYWAHSLYSLKRNILEFIGMGPVRLTLIGMVANPETGTVADWVGKLEQLGRVGG